MSIWSCYSHKHLCLPTTAYTYNRPCASCPRNLSFYEIVNRSVESGFRNMMTIKQTFIIGLQDYDYIAVGYLYRAVHSLLSSYYSPAVRYQKARAFSIPLTIRHALPPNSVFIHERRHHDYHCSHCVYCSFAVLSPYTNHIRRYSQSWLGHSAISNVFHTLCSGFGSIYSILMSPIK